MFIFKCDTLNISDGHDAYKCLSISYMQFKLRKITLFNKETLN